MGRMQAEGYAEAVRDGLVSLHNALLGHLTSNHYPPLPYSYVRVAQEALEHAEAREWDARVQLNAHTRPLPRTAFQDAQSGMWYAKAEDLIEFLHLEPFMGLTDG